MYNEMNKMIDRETFRAIVKHFGTDYSDGGFDREVVDNLVNVHIRNKKHIFELFGGKLKVEKEIETSIPETELKALRRQLINCDAFKGGKFLFVRTFLSDLEIEEFGQNVVACERKYFNVTIPKGMKVSKALAKLCLPEHTHLVQTEHSMILQQTKTKGKLVLSIDPCDYVTMSSNASGWRSCHRLDGGEYRTGPLAYLRDTSTVICYLASSKQCEFTDEGENYAFSNKSWRQIALVSPELEYSIQERQYPANNSINSSEVAELFKELFEEYNGVDYEKEMTPVHKLEELHIDYANETDEVALYYNDTTHEMYGSGYVVKPKEVDIEDFDGDRKPHKGEAVYCLNCGNDYCEDSDTLYCSECRNYDEEEDEYDEW